VILIAPRSLLDTREVVLLKDKTGQGVVDGGLTALHMAAINDDPELVKLLLDAGAEVSEKALWKMPGTTGRAGMVTARAIANQRDLLECRKHLMGASVRKEGAEREEVPEWAKKAGLGGEVGSVGV
jgi:hypothetical protein